MSTVEDNATRSMGGKLALWVFIPLRLLHLGDGALRVADVRHTNRAGSRPNQHSRSATEKWLNALSLGVVWLILGSIARTPGLAKTGIPPTLSQKRASTQGCKVAADMSG